jgi:glucoamylase
MSCINVVSGISLQNTVNLYRIGHFYFAKTGHYYIALTRDVLLVDFMLKGDAGLQLYLLAAPRIGEDVTSNLAWTDEWADHLMLWAEQGPFGMALAAVDREGRPALLQRSVGLVGKSDGWQDFKNNNGMTWHYAQAGPGEVAFTAQTAMRRYVGPGAFQQPRSRRHIGPAIAVVRF